MNDNSYKLYRGFKDSAQTTFYDSYMPSDRTAATPADGARPFTRKQKSQTDIDDLRKTLQPGTRLRDVREKRRQIQQKFLRITTRMNFMRKKESESLKNAIEAKTKMHQTYLIRARKASEDKIKQELAEKQRFEQWKKSQEVETFKHHLEFNKKLVQESTHARKIRDIQRFKGRRYSQRLELSKHRQISLNERQSKRDNIVEQHEKQSLKKQMLEIGRKIISRDNVEEKIEFYESETAKIYQFIENLRKKENELSKHSEKSGQIFKSILDDFNKLKKS